MNNRRITALGLLCTAWFGVVASQFKRVLLTQAAECVHKCDVNFCLKDPKENSAKEFREYWDECVNPQLTVEADQKNCMKAAFEECGLSFEEQHQKNYDVWEKCSAYCRKIY